MDLFAKILLDHQHFEVMMNNFHKYLIGRDGKSVQSFGSRVNPESAEFVGEIEKQLAIK